MEIRIEKSTQIGIAAVVLSPSEKEMVQVFRLPKINKFGPEESSYQLANIEIESQRTSGFIVLVPVSKVVLLVAVERKTEFVARSKSRWWG